MSEKEVLVPNIGDFKDVEVIEVLIEAGSNINKDDPIITIESDKSSVEIPSPYSGSVKKVNLKVGDKVSEGSSILIIGSEEEKPDEQIEEEVKEIKQETIIQYNTKIEKRKTRSITTLNYKEKTVRPNSK